MSFSSKIFALVIAGVSGIAMALQGSMNSGLAKIVGLLQATFTVHLTAAIATLILLFGLNQAEFSKFLQAPWYYYLGGILGVLITYGVVASMPKVGVANATAAIIVGQVTAACVIDCLGLFGLEKMPFAWYKLLGVALLAAGARIMLN